MKILVDTNILVRSSHVGSSFQGIAVNALNRLRDQQHELRTVPQVLYEFWAVATRPVENNGLGLSVATVDMQLRLYQTLFPTLRDERGILLRWQTLALESSVVGKQTHDARLVAAMYRHGLTHLLTFNSAHFDRYQSISVLDPGEIVMGSSAP